MKSKIKIKIVSKGKYGDIIVKMDKEKLKLNWEYGFDKYVAIIQVPTKEEWKNKDYKRLDVLNKVAEEVCKKKCKNCDFEIADNVINIIQNWI